MGVRACICPGTRVVTLRLGFYDLTHVYEAIGLEGIGGQWFPLVVLCLVWQCVCVCVCVCVCKGKRYSVYSLASTEMFTRPSVPRRPVHTETISIPRGIFQSSWQHIAHKL